MTKYEKMIKKLLTSGLFTIFCFTRYESRTYSLRMHSVQFPLQGSHTQYHGWQTKTRVANEMENYTWSRIQGQRKPIF